MTASTIGTLGKAGAASAGGALWTGLGAGLSGLLAYWLEGPALISGDADSSLLATGRDLLSEDRVLHGQFDR